MSRDNMLRCSALALVLTAFPTVLHAVDGVKLIDQAKALAGGVTPGDAPGFPVTISVSGSYQLSGDLSVPADTTAIDITTDDVTLNLNGFSITGSLGALGAGVDSHAGSNVVVLNGTISRMGRNGLDLGGSRNRVENVRTYGNGAAGITMGLSGSVKGSVAANNGGSGISATTGAVIVGNTVTNNQSTGIRVGVGSMVSVNVVGPNGGVGLSCVFVNPFPFFIFPSHNAGYVHNVFSDNAGGSVSGGTSLGQNLCDGVVC